MNSDQLLNTQDNLVLDGVPDMLRDKLIEMKCKLDSVEHIVKQIESKPIKELESELTQLEMAKLNWINIYAINSLFFTYLKTNCVNLKDHPIMSELQRVKDYMSRINEISKEEELKNVKNTNKIDKESSTRIIKRSLWMHANNKNKNFKVSELINTTLDSTIQNELNENNKRENEDVLDKNEKKLKTN